MRWYAALFTGHDNTVLDGLSEAIGGWATK